MDAIKLVRETYTDRHAEYINEEGWRILRKTRNWFVIATPTDESGTFWDVWLSAKSVRQLSALSRLLEPYGLVWTELDQERYTKCSVYQLFDILDDLGLSKRKRLTGKKKLRALANLPKAPLKALEAL